MSDELTIVLTAGLVATATGLLGPFLVLRRVALMADAVSHAVLPGIVVVFLLLGTRAPLPVVLGASLFAVICVLGVDALKASGLVAADAAIALVFPVLFSLGVIGISRYASEVHLDLDSTIYGEIAFVPFRTVTLGGVEIARSLVALACVCLVNLTLVVLLWKEFKASTFDPEFSRTVGIHPNVLSRLLLVAVAVTAVIAFEPVGAILVVTMVIVPATTAYLLTDSLRVMVVLAVGVGWASALAGYAGARAVDASIPGSMGLAAVASFTLALLLAPRYGVLTRALHRSGGIRRRRSGSRPEAARSTALG